MSVCCKDCNDRVVGCHSNCQRYKEYRKDMDDFNQKKKHDDQLDGILYGYNKRKMMGINGKYRKKK